MARGIEQGGDEALTRSGIWALFFVSCLFVIAGCSDVDRKSKEYKVGYKEGYQYAINNARSDIYEKGVRDGVNNAREAIFNDGYKKGFEAARPGFGGELTGIEKFITIGITIIGISKILMSLLYFQYKIIFLSEKMTQTYGKICVTIFSACVVLWLEYLVTIGFSHKIEDIFLSAASEEPLKKLIWGFVGGSSFYFILIAVERISKFIKNKLMTQSIVLFCLSFMFFILVPTFVFLVKIPNINKYLFYDVIFGVVLGGILYVVRSFFVNEGRNVFAATAKSDASLLPNQRRD